MPCNRVDLRRDGARQARGLPVLTVKPTLPLPEDESLGHVRALGEMASLCGEALEAASVAAADPQWRALLLHRGNLQLRAATDLTARLAVPADLGGGRPGLPPAGSATRERPTDTALQIAHRRALRCVSACAAILRGEMSDPLLRSLLIRYYHEASDLVRVLEQHERERFPGSDRRMAARAPMHRSPHR